MLHHVTRSNLQPVNSTCTARKLIEKINNLFQVDVNRREQGCAAHYTNSIVNMLLQHCSTVTTWNNMVDNLFIVGHTTLFTPVDINLEQPGAGCIKLLITIL
jgi:hypothetical protein